MRPHAGGWVFKESAIKWCEDIYTHLVCTRAFKC